MPKYAALIKYTAEAMDGIRSEGYAKRPQDLAAFAESLGGSMEFFEYIANGEYDLLMIFEMPSTDAYLALTSIGSASGTVERSALYELHSGEAVDAAIAAHPTTAYQRPGE